LFTIWVRQLCAMNEFGTAMLNPFFFAPPLARVDGSG
jgi:hypothetical protein